MMDWGHYDSRRSGRIVGLSFFSECLTNRSIRCPTLLVHGSELTSTRVSKWPTYLIEQGGAKFESLWKTRVPALEPGDMDDTGLSVVSRIQIVSFYIYRVLFAHRVQWHARNSRDVRWFAEL